MGNPEGPAAKVWQEIDAWVQRRIGRHMERVTSGSFTYVAVDDKGRPRRVPPDNTAN